jgi:VWFA-related protein
MRTAAMIAGLAVLLAGVAASARLRGEPAVGQASGQASGQNQQPQTPPTFRAGATVIEVDVSVRDKDRRFVSDLRLEDFEVFEDGARQEISVVYRVLGPNEPAPAAVAAAVPDLPEPPPQQVQRVIVLLFDHAHIAPGGFERARRAALDFMKKDFRDGDVGGVVNGGTMVNNRLTSSGEELEAAVAGIKPAPETGTVTRELRQWPRFVDLYEARRVVRNEPASEAGARTVLDQVVRRACIDQPSSCERGGAAMVESEVQNKAIQLVGQARLLAKQTLDTVAGLANGLARLPGRKTIILLTEGFFVEDSWTDLRDVVGRTARASVRIYALDTRGLNRGSAGSDIINSANPAQMALAPPAVGDIAADGPNSLAVDTGGYVIRNENDFGKAFTEIDRDTSSYYVLGFRTARPLDGKFRTLDVKVRRPGVTVRARKGYMATPDLARAAETSLTKPADPAAPSPAPAAKAAEAAAPPGGPPAEAAVVAGAAPEPSGTMRMRPDMARQVTALEPRSAAAATTPFPDALTRQATQGWDAYQRGDVAAARPLLEGPAAHPAAPPWVVYVLGWTQSAASEPRLAAASWERVRTGVPEFSAVYFDLADTYLQQREFGKAVEVLRQAETRWPKDVEVYNALGVVQLARGALDDAIETFAKGVGVSAGDPAANYNLAKSCELRFVRASRQRRAGASSVPAAGVLQDRDRAIEHYRRTIQAGGPFVEQAREGLKRLGAQ